MRPSPLVAYSVLSIAVLAQGAELTETVIGACTVCHHRGHAALARQVGVSVGAILTELNGLLGVPFREPVRVRLTVSLDEFREHIGSRVPEWSLAVARMDRNEVVVRADRLGLTLADSVVSTLRHELCHLALHGVERGKARRLPLWFHEGVACYLSGQNLFTDWRTFDVAAAHGALLPLASLRDGYPRDRASVALAYLQSEDFVRFLATERSRDAIRWIVDVYQKTGDFEQAVARATGEDLASLEQRWRLRYVRRFPWLHTLWKGTTLFGVLAVATMIAYGIRRVRARRLQLRWEQEDWRMGVSLRRAERPYEADVGEEDGKGWE